MATSSKSHFPRKKNKEAFIKPLFGGPQARLPLVAPEIYKNSATENTHLYIRKLGQGDEDSV